MWIEIFKTGKHTDSNGNTSEYSDNEIQQIADRYNTNVAKDPGTEAPIVKGHPETNDPAFGWVEKLKTKSGRLMAKLKDIAPEFAEEVKSGRFKKVSVALYPDNLLRHVGFLGAFPPAVKGLKPVNFSDENDYKEFTYTERSSQFEELAKKNEKLKSENIELKSKLREFENEKKVIEFDEFITALVYDSKITPVQGKQLKKILLKSSDSKEYSEGRSITELIKEFAEGFPANDELTSEFAEDELPEDPDDFAEKNTEPERLAIHRRASQLCKNNPDMDYEEAIIIATNE